MAQNYKKFLLHEIALVIYILVEHFLKFCLQISDGNLDYLSWISKCTELK